MNYLYAFSFICLLFSCSQNNHTETEEPSENKEAVVDSTDRTEMAYGEAYHIFHNAFEPDMDNQIDSTVLSMVFPDERLILEVEPIQMYEMLELNYIVYIFRGNHARIHYMAVFDRETSKVIDIRDFMEDVHDIDTYASYGNGMTLVRSKFAGEEEESRAIYIVDRDGYIHMINGLSIYETPYLEEEYGMLTGIHHGDRYYTVNESTDIIGTHIVYDLKENKCLGKFSTNQPCKFENDTLKLQVPGKYLGDSLSLSKLRVMEYRIHNGELVDSIPAGIMLMH